MPRPFPPCLASCASTTARLPPLTKTREHGSLHSVSERADKISLPGEVCTRSRETGYEPCAIHVEVILRSLKLSVKSDSAQQAAERNGEITKRKNEEVAFDTDSLLSFLSRKPLLRESHTSKSVIKANGVSSSSSCCSCLFIILQLCCTRHK